MIATQTSPIKEKEVEKEPSERPPSENPAEEELKEAIAKAMIEQEKEAKKQSRMVIVSAKEEYAKQNQTLAAFVDKMAKEFFNQYQFM